MFEVSMLNIIQYFKRKHMSLEERHSQERVKMVCSLLKYAELVIFLYYGKTEINFLKYFLSCLCNM